MENLYDRQVAFEKEAVQLGVDRFNSNQEKTEGAETYQGLALIRGAIEPLIKRLEVYFADKSVRKSPQGRMSYDFLTQFKPHEVAFYTLRTVITDMSKDVVIQGLAQRVMGSLIDHIEYQAYEKEAGNHLKAVKKGLNTSNKRHIRTVVLRAKRSIGIEDIVSMTNAQKVRIGAMLIDFVVEATGICEYRRKAKVGGTGHNIYVMPTEKVTSWWAEQNDRLSLMRPQYMPMLHPPVDWTDPYDGGFLTGIRTMRVRLIRSNYGQEAQADKMPLVYQAVNAIQQVKWRINPFILETARYMWEHGIACDSIPSAEPPHIPSPPWNSEEEFEILKETDLERVKEWKRMASALKGEWNIMQNQRKAVMISLTMAERLVKEEAIYFVVSLDWRGRLYYVSNYIHPQADDFGASFLEFGEGKPVGPHGGIHLARAGAGLYGVDKVSMKEREQWVAENEHLILACASDPIACQWWHDADKPFKFLAWCKEWEGFKRDGVNHISHISCPLDGSCNALQHTSAMLRDTAGATIVNLVDSERPTDAYQKVADHLLPIIVRHASEGNEYAQYWQDKVNRSRTKTGVMTTGYGVTQRGVIDQILEQARKDKLKDDITARGLSFYKTCEYLGKLLYTSIGDVLPSSHLVKEWYQSLARACAGYDKPLETTTPVGFKIVHEYRKLKKHRIRTMYGTQCVDLVVGEHSKSEPIDWKKVALGFSPNITHGNDSSHLMFTALAFLGDGGVAFASIHDSFGTHCCDIPKLNYHTREQFIKMYTERDFMQDLLDQLKAQLPQEYIEKLPEALPKGDFDVNNVRGATFFFA